MSSVSVSDGRGRLSRSTDQPQGSTLPLAVPSPKLGGVVLSVEAFLIGGELLGSLHGAAGQGKTVKEGQEVGAVVVGGFHGINPLRTPLIYMKNPAGAGL